MSPWDRGTGGPGTSSARRASGVLYMNLLAGEAVWQPCCVKQTGTSEFRARSGQRHRREHHLVLDEGAWSALVLTLERGAGLRAPLGFSHEVRSRGFADDRLFIGELAILHLLSQKSLEVVGEGDIHGDSWNRVLFKLP